VTLNTHPLHCLFFSPPIGGDPDDSLTISSLLLPTCKVHEGDSSHHQIGPLPFEFVLPLLQFCSTLYLDEKSSKLFWMTEGEIYSVSLVRFTAIHGLQDHTHYPKKLHDDHVIKHNQMHFMYENDKYKLSKVERFKLFFCSIGFCGRLCLPLQKNVESTTAITVVDKG
jgi:hypothetical protein